MRGIAGAFALLSVAGLLAAVLPAQAQSTEPQGEPAVGVGIICDTSDQAEQFVSLRGKGMDAHQAMRQINAAAKDPGACGLAAVAFTRDKTIDQRPMGNSFVQIVRITVVAGYTGSVWQRVSSLTTQYAVIEAEGTAI